MNKVFLIGNLTRDPELKSTATSIPVCTFTVAVGRRFNPEEVDFIPVKVWRSLAENCAKYLKKGSKCAVSGALQVQNYETAEGQKRYFFEINAEEVQFLSRLNFEDNQESAEASEEASAKSVEDLEEDTEETDLPF